MRHRIPARFLPTIAACLALGVLAGPAAAQTAGGAVQTVTVEKGWTHTTARPGVNAAGFFTIHNGSSSPDTLVSASCPIAHQTELVDGGGNKVDSLTIRPGETLALSTATAHLILKDNRFRLYPKATVPCSVDFRNAGKMILYLFVEPKNAGRYHKAHGTPVDH